MALTRYGELRNQLLRQSFPSVFAPVIVRDGDSNYVPIPVSERLAQCIWYDQRLAAGNLRTTDGRRVRVIFPGWWNLEAGPDFRHATVQIGDEPEITGDVEIHLRADDWFHHGHERDALYNNVVLHVVLWEAGSERAPATRAGDRLPQLVLQHHLDSPLESLYDEIDLESYPHNTTGHGGRCAHILTDMPADRIAGLLDAAGDERFAVKARKFARWIHRVGQAQAFYEGWMEALGYKSNKAGFRALAQRFPVAAVAALGKRGYNTELPAMMFGLANFLPRTKGGDAYTKRLWSRWWKLRPDFEDKILDAGLWRLAGIRPANHPHRRLGAAVALLKKHPNLMEKVTGDDDPARFFTGIRDEYWSRHFTLAGKPQSRDTELIGASRAQEIVANVVLPFLAATGDESASTRYAALGAAAGNSVARLAGRQLFGNARNVAKTTRQQQGLLQIFQDFCLNDKSGCTQCQFPELARRWAAR